MTIGLEESRQSVGAGADPIKLAKVGHVRLFTNQEMIFNTVDSPVIQLTGLNSIMLVVGVTAASNLGFLGMRRDPHGFGPLESNSPFATNSLITAGAGVVTWSWGAFTTLGGGPNQDTTMMVWEFMILEVTEGVGQDTFMTVDLYGGKR